MNYRINLDGIYSSIKKTNDPVDDNDVFKTLGEAKEMILYSHYDSLNSLKQSIKHIKGLKANELETE